MPFISGKTYSNNFRFIYSFIFFFFFTVFTAYAHTVCRCPIQTKKKERKNISTAHLKFLLADQNKSETIAGCFASLYSEEYCSALAFQTRVSCRSTKWILCDNLRLAPFQNKPKCQSALACDDSRQPKPISSRVRNGFLMLSISLSLGKRQDCTQCCNDLETDCHERGCLYHTSIQEPRPTPTK